MILHLLGFLALVGTHLVVASVVSLEKRIYQDDLSQDLQAFDPRKQVAVALKDAARISIETNALVTQYLNTLQDPIDAVFRTKLLNPDQYIQDRDTLYIHQSWYKNIATEMTYEWHRQHPEFKKDLDHPGFRAELQTANSKMHEIVDESVDRLEGLFQLSHDVFYSKELFEIEAVNRGPKPYNFDKDEEPIKFLPFVDNMWNGNITRGVDYYQVMVDRTSFYSEALHFHEKAIPYNQWQVLKARDQLWLWQSRKRAYEALYIKGNANQRKKKMIVLWKKKRHYKDAQQREMLKGPAPIVDSSASR